MELTWTYLDLIRFIIKPKVLGMYGMASWFGCNFHLAYALMYNLSKPKSAIACVHCC